MDLNLCAARGSGNRKAGHLIEHDLIGKPVSTPDQGRGYAFPDDAPN
jgi:hypothetical protein